MDHIPNLRTIHFPAMPIYSTEQLRSTARFPSPSIPETNFWGYTMTRSSNSISPSSTTGDSYRPFWITHGPDVAVDRHRRVGGLRIVSDGSDDNAPSLIEFDEDFEDEPDPADFDIFNDEDMDLGPWFPEPNDSDSEFSDHHVEHHPIITPDEWMEGLTLGMGNLSIAQLDFSALDGHSSDDLANEHDDIMSHFSEDL
ncbi:hypothetical protein BDV93DRAFT_149023 [Ceratobasidium sp. AG-I]|nr:hypothetical protein BDV93DRAFT_149023 [Ceratobasidium sp. AG-I]